MKHLNPHSVSFKEFFFELLSNMNAFKIKRLLLYCIFCYAVLNLCFIFVTKYLTFFKTSQLRTKISYSLNKKYVINGNVAQYSSYIILDQQTHRIEALVQLNKKKFDVKENFMCIVKLANDSIIELEAVDSIKFYYKSNVKLVFNINEIPFAELSSVAFEK